MAAESELDATISALVSAVVGAGLSRKDLLNGVDPSVSRSLLHLRPPSAQIRQDVQQLLERRLRGDPRPLDVWLRNALRLTQDKPEYELFRRVAAELGVSPPLERREERAPAKAPPVQLFLSSSPGEHDLVKGLLEQLALQVREGLLVPWHRGLAATGKETAEEARLALSRADVALLFVSAGLLASRELTSELEHALSPSCRARPLVVIASPCLWQYSIPPRATAPWRDGSALREQIARTSPARVLADLALEVLRAARE